MAAGLGFKDFTTGEVLTAADVDGYLMQNIWVFASAAARDAAVTSPQEGNFAYLKDTNVTTYYTGSAWANLDTTGMTNPMTTTGDTIYSSSGSTPARLGIGSTGQVLTVSGGVPSWATPAGGSFVGVRCKKSATAQTISNSTSTIVTWTDTDVFDTDSFHDTSTNPGRLTVPSGKDGYYKIYWNVQWAAPNATGRRSVQLYKNGLTNSDLICACEITPNATSYPSHNASVTQYLVAGDYVQLGAYQESGGNLNIDTSAGQNFGMEKIG